MWLSLGTCGFAVAPVAFSLALGGEGWRHVMSSWVFRARETEVDATVMRQRKEHIQILFYEDAADATVSVEKGDGVGAPADLGLRINGKADASSRADLCTQLLLGHLPLLARPDSQEVFLLGLGSGITAAAVLAHPVKRLTIAENCEPVIRAARLFAPWNRGVLTNPVTTIWREDARTVLKLSPMKYDVIITQPSNPWMVGVGSVFSRECYELAASRLKQGGITVQWFHLYEMHDGIVALVLRTFGSVFPFVEIWDSGAGDIVLLGSQSPWPASTQNYSRVFERELVRTDLQTIGISSTAALLARQLASQRTAFAIAGDGPIQNDLFPVLEYQAPKAFYIGNTSHMLWQFDERTRQVDLCPADKRQSLSALDDEALRRLFSQYSSVNSELLTKLSLRLQGPVPSENQPLLSAAAIPSVFEKDPAKQRSPFAQNPTDDIRPLSQAADLIATEPQRRKEGIQQIEQLLHDYHGQSRGPIIYFVSVAVKASLNDGDIASARRILILACERVPDDSQLLYLSRIVERKEALNATKL